MSLDEDKAEWAAWLAYDPETRKEKLTWARDEVDADDLRLLAGKALYGQPFGFTWEDVDRIREHAAELSKKAIRDVESSGLSADDSHYSLGAMWGEEAVEWGNLADRIARLLPPREKAG